MRPNAAASSAVPTSAICSGVSAPRGILYIAAEDHPAPARLKSSRAQPLGQLDWPGPRGHRHVEGDPRGRSRPARRRRPPLSREFRRRGRRHGSASASREPPARAARSRRPPRPRTRTPYFASSMTRSARVMPRSTRHWSHANAARREVLGDDEPGLATFSRRTRPLRRRRKAANRSRAASRAAETRARARAGSLKSLGWQATRAGAARKRSQAAVEGLSRGGAGRRRRPQAGAPGGPQAGPRDPISGARSAGWGVKPRQDG
jgi:hypothetical protein